MTPVIILIVCAIVLLIAILHTHTKAYLEGLERGITEFILFIREVSPEAEEILIRDMEAKHMIFPGENAE